MQQDTGSRIRIFRLLEVSHATYRTAFGSYALSRRVEMVAGGIWSMLSELRLGSLERFYQTR